MYRSDDYDYMDDVDEELYGGYKPSNLAKIPVGFAHLPRGKKSSGIGYSSAGSYYDIDRSGSPIYGYRTVSPVTNPQTGRMYYSSYAQQLDEDDSVSPTPVVRRSHSLRTGPGSRLNKVSIRPLSIYDDDDDVIMQQPIRTSRTRPSRSLYIDSELSDLEDDISPIRLKVRPSMMQPRPGAQVRKSQSVTERDLTPSGRGRSKSRKNYAEELAAIKKETRQPYIASTRQPRDSLSTTSKILISYHLKSPTSSPGYSSVARIKPGKKWLGLNTYDKYDLTGSTSTYKETPSLRRDPSKVPPTVTAAITATPRSKPSSEPVETTPTTAPTAEALNSLETTME